MMPLQDFPDVYFDVVHLRALVAGVSPPNSSLVPVFVTPLDLIRCQIRDWAPLVNEAVRVTKSSGIVVFVDGLGSLRQVDVTESELAPGFATFSRLLQQ